MITTYPHSLDEESLVDMDCEGSTFERNQKFEGKFALDPANIVWYIK
jgi:hypothetical protein